MAPDAQRSKARSKMRRGSSISPLQLHLGEERQSTCQTGAEQMSAMAWLHQEFCTPRLDPRQPRNAAGAAAGGHGQSASRIPARRRSRTSSSADLGSWLL